MPSVPSLEPLHIPVMLDQCLKELKLEPGGWYIDGTFGAGGHTRAMLARGVKVLAIDRDFLTQSLAEELTNDNFIFIKDNFSNLETIVKSLKINPIRGSFI